MTVSNANDLKHHFLGWQCRIRQHAVRKHEGRPSSGIAPNVQMDGMSLGPIMTMIVKLDPDAVTNEFRFMIQKTQDPKQRQDNALKFLSEYYYQRPQEFSDEVTAVFALDNPLANQLDACDECTLIFEQGNQKFELVCETRSIPSDEQNYQATYWHNHLFNPHMPGVVKIIGFAPDWDKSNVSTIEHP